MRDYENMSPCERADYFRAELRRLHRAAAPRAGSLLEQALRRLLRENEQICRENRPPSGEVNRTD
jgi:hypothetical protein